MKTLKMINDKFIKISEFVACILSAAVCAMIVYWAANRYFFSKEFFGAEELILAVAFWMYFIGSYIATHEDSHISADLFTSMLKTERAKNYAKLLRLVISLLAYALLAWLAWEFLAFDISKHKITVMYRFPQAWIHVILPISFILSSLYTIAHIIKTVIDLKEGPQNSMDKAQPDQPDE